MKKINILLIVASFFLPAKSGAQYTRYIVQLKDKAGSSFSISSPSAYLSARAIARRARYGILIDSTDLPVRSAYLDSVRLVPNVTVLNISKWLNQICIRTSDPAALAKINSFPFVKILSPVAVRISGSSGQPGKKEEYEQLPIPVTGANQARIFGISGMQDFYNYGSNAGQIHIHEGEYLHNLGYRGEGMIIAVLDAGFNNYKNNPAFDSIRLQNQVLGEWDYVAGEQSVNEDDTHGAWCLSTIAANEPGKIVGTAPKAKFWLLRTEDASSEYPVEEANWVVAAEFADSAGADIITSSLGYSDFDDPSFNHSYAQRDGKTSMISRGATMAVKKGMLVTNSAGNSGSSSTDAKYVICPADADSVLTIGATDVNGNMASFSSYGPNGGGHLKPNVVSVGWNSVVASTVTGNPVFLSGTSFSNPNLCGLVACLWQAFPEFTNMEIIAALQRNASKATSPDYRFGYGIPNMRLAYADLDAQRTIRNYQVVLGNDWIKAYPVPFIDKVTVLLKAPLTGTCSLRLLDMAGKTIQVKKQDIQQDQIYSIGLGGGFLSRGVYTIQYLDGKNKRSLRIIRQ